MKSNLLFIFFLALTLQPLNSAQAGTFYHVDMPDEEVVSGQKLQLNGMGLREVTHMMMDFDVYVAGLYVVKKTTSGQEIINSTTPRQIKMKFLRDIPAAKSRETWGETFDKLCKKPKDANLGEICKKAAPGMEEFKKAIEDTKKDNVMNYTITEKRVEIDRDGKVLGIFNNPDLGKFFLIAWLGDKPIGDLLRDRLLGIKK